MDQVTVAVGAALPLTLTSHPLQRSGAWAVTVLAGRDTPEGVSVEDLEDVADRLVADVCAAAASSRQAVEYDWWKVLFALFPNSKATHNSRPRDRAALQPAISQLFAPDDTDDTDESDDTGVWPCTFCGVPSSVVWTKMVLPMFDTDKAINTLPPGVPGWPVCRGCRVAMWALPYGAWVTAGSATVLTCEEPAVERAFVTRNVRRARRIAQVGFDGLPATAGPEHVVAVALRQLAPELPATAVLWSFKNDNQDPWLRVSRTRRATARFLSMVGARAPLRAGWSLLEQALTARDKDGQVVADGRQGAARSLFEAEDGSSRPFLTRIHHLLVAPARRWLPYELGALATLGSTYAEEVLGMEPRLASVATLLVDWIEHGSASPRGRFAEYRAVALKPYQLGQLLMQAQSRLMLDGRAAPAGPEDCAALISTGPRSWEQRMLLFFSVTELLVRRGVSIGGGADPDDEERIKQLVEQPILESDEEDAA
ncbi:hypothetical protein AQ490_19550 [Wenjunlia vitaminophila]|uniref:CRISPR-associated protein Cst1 n=1 Tax=Wenjunlia vitaminophila TaxID=76728 RepID=A0A0T6LU36_WENVI|nr:hypothetical protein [Wenjunlia vitaminophila]KRV49528.1 hypothetical protein AQ490_19550 [Wenjunlia vitaminophila]